MTDRQTDTRTQPFIVKDTEIIFGALQFVSKCCCFIGQNFIFLWYALNLVNADLMILNRFFSTILMQKLGRMSIKITCKII